MFYQLFCTFFFLHKGCLGDFCTPFSRSYIFVPGQRNKKDQPQLPHLLVWCLLVNLTVSLYILWLYKAQASTDKSDFSAFFRVFADDNVNFPVIKEF